MSSPAGSTTRVAERMTEWFADVVALSSRYFFDVAMDERHRRAATLSVLARNAKVVVASELDRTGALFEPVCLALAAACRLLDVQPSVAHWQAAVHNVRDLEVKLRTTPSLSSLGLTPLTAASVFKQQLDEALINGGVTDRPTILDHHSRQVSLGLAVNWGIRFLLSYATETVGAPPEGASEARDLAWIRRQLQRPSP